MPETEMNFRLTFSVPHPFQDLNNLIKDVKNTSEVFARSIFPHIMIQLQNQLVDLYLGKDKSRKQRCNTPWRCPRCKSQHGFLRRGWRSKNRQIKTSIGILEFPLRNLTCSNCNKTFSPFVEYFGLEPWQRLSKELIEKNLYLATQMSYARSSKTVKELLNESISSSTIHRHVQKYSKEIDCRSKQIKGKTLMFDDTMVPAGFKDSGATLLLGISIDGESKVYGRTKIKKSIVSFAVDRSWRDLRHQLKDLKPEVIVTDGAVNIKGMLNECFPTVPVQQCLWHLYKTTAYYFWSDGLPVEDRNPLLRELKGLIERIDVDGIFSFVEKLRSSNLFRAANFIAENINSTLAYTRTPMPYKATSPIEREMREINRRTDLGARWTISGIANLLNLRLAYEKNQDGWKHYWNQCCYSSYKNSLVLEKI